MKKRYAINFGVSRVNEHHFGTPERYDPGEVVANNYTNFFTEINFNCSKSFLNEKATTDNLINELTMLAEEFNEGDFLVLTFCGHSKRILKTFTKIATAINEDEGWQMYNRIFFHFELWQLIKKFQKGVKILIISDSCYSGSLEAMYFHSSFRKGTKNLFHKHKIFYNDILKESEQLMLHEVPPAVIVFSSSSEGEISNQLLSEENITIFSDAFFKAWANVKSSKGLSDFFAEISWEMFLKTAKDNKQIFFDSPGKIQNRIAPKWHYVQGHMSTKIRIETPMFN